MRASSCLPLSLSLPLLFSIGLLPVQFYFIFPGKHIDWSQSFFTLSHWSPACGRFPPRDAHSSHSEMWRRQQDPWDQGLLAGQGFLYRGCRQGGNATRTDVLGHLGALKLFRLWGCPAEWLVSLAAHLASSANTVGLEDTKGIRGISECFLQHQQQAVSFTWEYVPHLKGSLHSV